MAVAACIPKAFVMPRLSVAMATYNGAAYIREQLDSLAKQTLLPDELVVTDDGSTDDTCAQVRAFAETAPFKVLLHENGLTLGYGQNFARALTLSRGDIVFPCDQDDVWMPDKIEIMAQALDAKPNTAVMLCDTLLCDRSLKPNGETKIGRIRANGLPESAHVMGCCCALRRTYLDLALPLPLGVRSHDNWLVQMADELGLAERLNVPLQYYRLHGNNTSDFFVNRVEKQEVLYRSLQKLRDLLRRFLKAGGMAEEYEMLCGLLDHITARESGFSKITGNEALSNAIASMQHRRMVLGLRLSIRASPLLVRPVAIVSLWRSGGYKGAGGLMSVFKDLAFFWGGGK